MPTDLYHIMKKSCWRQLTLRHFQLAQGADVFPDVYEQLTWAPTSIRSCRYLADTVSFFFLFSFFLLYVWHYKTKVNGVDSHPIMSHRNVVSPLITSEGTLAQVTATESSVCWRDIMREEIEEVWSRDTHSLVSWILRIFIPVLGAEDFQSCCTGTCSLLAAGGCSWVRWEILTCAWYEAKYLWLASGLKGK